MSMKVFMYSSIPPPKNLANKVVLPWPAIAETVSQPEKARQKGRERLSFRESFSDLSYIIALSPSTW